MDQLNPFALVRASDYTDEQINSLWVEVGAKMISTIIEPSSIVSKFILGGKGTGKTHLLRHYSYPASRLRSPNESGISTLKKQKSLAIFLRATSVDAARFESTSADKSKWQHLFGIYLELRLVEGVLDALCNIKDTSINDAFDDQAFIAEMGRSVVDQSILECQSINDFREWVIQERRKIDDAVNNEAFTGSLDLRVPFSISSLCLPVGRAIGKWNPSLSGLPLIYLIDEIENFSATQQQVVNTLVRYGEGLATFRVTGRLYAIKTLCTIADGEENREGAEFKTVILDDILRDYRGYPDFAKRFVYSRLGFVRLTAKKPEALGFDLYSMFEEVDTSEYYSVALTHLGLDKNEPSFIRKFIDTLAANSNLDASSVDAAKEIVAILAKDIPLLLQKLNLLLFCKKYKKNSPKISFEKKNSVNITLAKKIRSEALNFMTTRGAGRSSYKTAYGHYASDLFAQLCREAPKGGGVPYAGFDSFVRMSSGNPRNLLVILGKAYEISAFKNINFIYGSKLSIAIQTEAVLEAARFMFEQDTNYGSRSEQARYAASQLALILRTARYALNIPEVSPLAVSFSESDLTAESKSTLDSALNYSFVYEIKTGRPDRNSQRLDRKIQLNPLLSPRWGLPIKRGGDINLGKELLNSIFDPQRQNDFNLLLKGLSARWNTPFKQLSAETVQDELF